MARQPQNKPVVFSPPFPGVDYRIGTSITRSALVANNTDRKDGTVRGIYGSGPGLYAKLATLGICKGIKYLKRSTGSVDELIAGTAKYAVNGAEALLYDGSVFSPVYLGTTPTQKTSFAQFGPDILFVDGVGPLRLYKQSSSRIYPLEPVPVPGATYANADPLTFTTSSGDGGLVDDFSTDTNLVNVNTFNTWSTTTTPIGTHWRYNSQSVVKGTSFGRYTDATISVTSITHSTTTANVTATAHGFVNNDKVVIVGATPDSYNGIYTVTKDTNDTFHYTMASAPTSDASGTITAKGIKNNKDWSKVNTLSVTIYSDVSEQTTGGFLAFYFKSYIKTGGVITSVSTTVEKTLDITAAKTALTLEIDLTDVVATDKSSVYEYGFIANYATEFVVEVSSLRSNIGRKGKFEYVYTQTVTMDKPGDVTPFEHRVEVESRECEIVEVNNGDEGRLVTIYVGPATGVAKDTGVSKYTIYRRDIFVSSLFRKVDDVVAAATGRVTYEDTKLNVITGDVLREGRSNPPIGCIAVGCNDLRVMLSEVKGASEGRKCRLRISNLQDLTTFYDATLEMAEIYDFSPNDGLMIEVKEPILAIENIPVDTGNELVGNTLLLTENSMIILKGTEPNGSNGFDISRQEAGGVVGLKAVTKDDKGNPNWVSKSGEIWRIDASLQRENLGKQITPLINIYQSKGGFVLSYDPTLRRKILWCGTQATGLPRVFTMDLDDGYLDAGSPWDTLDTEIDVVDCGVYGYGDTAYSVLVKTDGTTKRMFDTSVARSAFDYSLPVRFNGAINVSNYIHVSLHGTGTVQARTNPNGLDPQAIVGVSDYTGFVEGAVAVGTAGEFTLNKATTLSKEWEELAIDIHGDANSASLVSVTVETVPRLFV